ncbi:hypothetical protein [Azospirillum sp. B2RO_4]|uniref:hypothetical protein n=1 Tax=Azospirillum sp. B2RO_4 TaxID=3027796 RepID=UPI003DA9415C
MADADRHLKFSDNAWDWLGKGVYFWEADPRRGYEWAVEACKAKGGEPFVIGAVIHLGNCLNLMDRGSLDALKSAYRSFEKFHARSFPGSPLPENKRTTKGPAHNLDCAVINHLHQMLAENVDADGNPSPLPPFNSVRGLYQEDDPVFDGSKILSKTHIQIAVLTPETSIQGYFRVPEAQYR